MPNSNFSTGEQENEYSAEYEGRNYPEKALQNFFCKNPSVLAIKNPQNVKSEYQTEVGRIDILVESGESTLWVIELKAGIANRDAIGQITSYIGAIRNKFPKKSVFGLLIAEDFDKSCLAAHKAISDVELKKYVTNYTVHDVAPMVIHKGHRFMDDASVIVDRTENLLTIRCPGCGTERNVSTSAHGVNCAACKAFIKIPTT